MPLDNEELRAALNSLDTTNDDHWTGQGLPLIDAVTDILGVGVTRADLTNAAPTFNRSTPFEDEADEADKADKADEADEAEFEQEKVNSREEFDKELLAVDEAMADCQATIVEAEKHLQGLKDVHTTLVGSRDKAFPPLTQAAVTRDYIKAGQKRRTDAAKRAEALRELM